MTQTFKSMNELLDYLGNLEERLKKLEKENQELQATAAPRETIREIVNEEAIERIVLDYLPNTNLLDHSFLKRAFAVWGHSLVASMIMGTVFAIIYACLMMVMFGSVFGSLVQSQ